MPSLEGDDLTKAELDYVIRLTWAEGDSMTVYSLANEGITKIGVLYATNGGTTSTTFSGDVKIPAEGESFNILFTHSKGLGCVLRNGVLSYDFSEQTIGTAATSVPFVVYDQMVLSKNQLKSSIKPTFKFPFYFLQLSMADLPKSQTIRQVEINGLKSELKMAYSTSSNLEITSGPEVSYNEDNVPYYNKPITLITSNENQTMKTLASGARSLYFVFPPTVGNASIIRDVYVTMGDYLNGYDENDTDATQYRGVMGNATHNAGKHSRTTISNFEQLDFDEQVVSFSVSATHPAAMTNAPESITTWKAGETMTLINLTTKEVFGGSLVAETAGETVTFSSNKLGCFHGINAGDELLLVSPAIYTNESATVFDEGGITIEGLIGSTFADTKPLLSGTAIVTKYSNSHTVEFDYMTSTVGLTVNGIAEYITAQQTLNSPRMRAASNEGFNNENGEWDETESFNIDIEKVVLANLPLYVLAYDASTGYKVTTVQNEYSELTLTETFHLAGTNPSLKVYYSVPATGQILPTAYLYSSSTEYYSGDATAAVTATKGYYIEQSATINETGEDTGGADPGEGGID